MPSLATEETSTAGDRAIRDCFLEDLLVKDPLVEDPLVAMVEVMTRNLFMECWEIRKVRGVFF